MRVNTSLLHGYPVLDAQTGAASIPKYQTSTFAQQKIGSKQKYSYTRFGNPTVHALEEAFAKLEKAQYALAYASGMAAISNVLMLLEGGDHLILPKEVYGGTCQFANHILPRYDVEVSCIDMSDIDEIKRHIKSNTKMIYLETPSNPLLKITDIVAVVELAKQHQILTVADNTFMTGLYQNPLTLGVDVVVESVTKFINGHSDVVAGLAVTNDEEIYQQLLLYQKNFGAVLGVEEAWLVLRGMKTMGLRMEKSSANATQIADFLLTCPNVKKVYYPTLNNHPDAQIHKKQATSGGAVLSFEVSSQAVLENVIDKIQLPILAVSLGGVESILSHPATMSHACLSQEEREKQGVTNNLLRLSCGIEDVEDLLEDLKQALQC